MTIAKTEVVSQLTESLKGASGVYLADFTGLTVEKVTVLRSDLRKKGVTMRVAKNTLIRRAFENVGVEGLDKWLTGPTALIFADAEDPMAPAKMLADFLKKNDAALSMKAIHVDGQSYTGDQLQTLAKMPGRRELQAQVVSLAMSPGATLIGLFNGPGSALASQIQSLVSKIEAGEEVGK